MRYFWIISALFLSLGLLNSCADSVPDNKTVGEDRSVDLNEIKRKGVIYEVNIRQFTGEGTFAAFSDHISRLSEMGVDIIWLMPIHPIGEKERKGELGSYYSVRDYKGINPEFGDEEDLRNLIRKAHDSGMIVILDWVPNHTAWDAVWTETNPEFYVREDGHFIIPPDTDWTDVIQLDYDNQEMRKAMMDAMAYWVSEFDIDGFRCDVAGYVPNDFWEEAISHLNEIKPVFMLAEWEDPTHHEVGFHMSYAWELHSIMNRLAQRESTFRDLREYWDKEQKRFPSDALRMVFIDNHDENSWNGTISERMGDNADAMAVFSFTFPGMPLIYTGQEAALDFRLPFFEKSEVPWGSFEKQDFYTQLIALKKENPSLWNAPHGAEPVFYPGHENLIAYSRNRENNTVFTVLNLSEEEQSFEIPLNSESAKDFFSGDEEPLTGGEVISLRPHSYKVWVIN